MRRGWIAGGFPVPESAAPLEAGGRPVVLDDGTVLLPGPLAAVLARPLRRLVRETSARDGVRPHPTVLAALTALERAEQAHAGGFDSETSVVGRGFDASCSATMSATDAAKRLGISPVAVRKAARDGRLAGERVGGAWAFRTEDVQRFEEERRA